MINRKDEDRRKYDLDRQHPLIPPGEARPTTDPETGRWNGPRTWRSVHGPATVYWSQETPLYVFDARFDDGTRGGVEWTLDLGFRRAGEAPRLWICGDIDIQPDDARFVERDQPEMGDPESDGDPNLEADLQNDAAFLRDLRSSRLFARVMYSVFRGRTFIHISDGDSWRCRDRQAARLVARLRNMGESYSDYYGDYDYLGSWPDDPPRSPVMLPTPPPAPSQKAKPAPKLPLRARFLLWIARRMLGTKAAEHQHYKAGLGTGENEKRSEATREYHRLLEDRLKTKAIMESDENAAVFQSLHAHLTRLGWRTETARDRESAADAALAERVEILRIIKRHEAKPARDPAPWAERYRNTAPGSGVWFVMTDAGTELTDEEQEASLAAFLEPRLRGLAGSGRIDETEFNALQARLDAADDD